jgi:hypothetical protein
MHIPELIDKRALQHARRLWLHYGVFWLGAIATGLVAVFYAKLIDIGYDTPSFAMRRGTGGCRFPSPRQSALWVCGSPDATLLAPKAAASLRLWPHSMTAAILRHVC